MAVRKRASQLTTQEQQLYIQGVTNLIQSGAYGQLVAIHADMRHMQHGSMGPIGRQRFLPWHRDFLLQLERQLQGLDANAFIPYWDWATDRSLPGWIAGFQPAVQVPGVRHPVQIHRSLGRHGRLASEFEVESLVTNTQLSYTTFTSALEGFHNDVHNWVGGTMSNIMISPADPVFWLHHAQVDRLWSQWQAVNTGKGPTLTGAEATLDPWNETVQQVRAIAQLGYSYQ